MAKKKTVTRIKGFIDWYDTGIWPATVMYSYGLTYDEMMNQLLKVKASEWAVGVSRDKELIDDKNCNWFGLKRTAEEDTTGQEVRCFYIIQKIKFDFSDDHYCKLAHEILHVCQFMMKDFLDIEREIEAVAYTHTYLMRKCLDSIRQNR